MSLVKDDPRDASLEVAYSTPPTWFRETNDGIGTSGMFLSGLIMITRNRFLAWPAVLFGINTVLNAHPMRAKEGNSGWSNLALSFSALFASYIPVFIITNTVKV